MAEEIKDEVVLNDDELICVLTGEKKKAKAKELMLQSVILQMNEEYGFEILICLWCKVTKKRHFMSRIKIKH